MNLTFVYAIAFSFATSPSYADGRLVFDESNLGSRSLSAAMQNWKQQELKAQGGEFKSHGWWPWGVSGADFDNDGDVDLYLSHHGQPGGRVFINLIEQGSLKFVASQFAARLPGADDKPWHYDINGDAWIDILGLSDEHKAKSMFNQQGQGFVTAGFSLLPLSHPKDVVDINHDGYLDIISNKFNYYYDNKQETYQKSNSDNGLLKELPIEFAKLEAEKKRIKKNRFFKTFITNHFVNGFDSFGASVNPVDLNSDGLTDIIFAGAGGYGGEYLGYYFTQHTATAKYEQANQRLNLPEMGFPILVQDLNNDGKQDLLIEAKESGGLYIQTSEGFVFEEGVISDFLRKTGSYTARAYPYDFDLDGDLDIVLSQPRRGVLEIMQNTGNGKFLRAAKYKSWDANAIFVVDIDNDGDLDIVAGGDGGHKSTHVRVLINNSKRVKDSIVLHLRGHSPNYYAVGAVVSVVDESALSSQMSQKVIWNGLPLIFTAEKASHLSFEVKYNDGSYKKFTGLRAGERYTLLPNGKMENGFIAAHLLY